MGGNRTIARTRAGVLASVVVLAVTAGLLTGCDPTTYTMTIKATPAGPVAPGSTVTISGKVSPARSGSTVVIERYVGGTWQKRAEGKLSASSTYSIAVKPSEVTLYTFRARWLGPNGAVATSGNLKLQVATAPGAPANVVASPGDRQAVVQWTPPDNRGSAIEEYQLRTNFGVIYYLSPSTTSLVASDLSNGTSFEFSVRAINLIGAGPWSAWSAPVVPFGNPSPPVISSSVSGTTITWTWPTPNGNGRPISGYQATLDGSSVSVGSNSFTRSFGPGETHTLTLRSVNSGGRTSTAASRSATTSSSASVSISKGSSAVGQSGCTHSSCRFIQVSTTGLGSGTHQYSCHSGELGQWWGPSISSGTSFQTTCYYGYPGHRVWIVVDGVKSNEITW